MKAKAKNFSGRNFKKKLTKDKLTKSRRSALMSRIRSKATKFESEFFKKFRKQSKQPFKKNSSVIRGKPDMVFSKKKVCVFLDSDFWHGWQYPRWKHLLKDNFWRGKISSNRARDKRTTAYLKRKGWKVLRFWEHEIKNNSRDVIDSIIKVIR